jgi:hypothetical protein
MSFQKVFIGALYYGDELFVAQALTSHGAKCCLLGGLFVPAHAGIHFIEGLFLEITSQLGVEFIRRSVSEGGLKNNKILVRLRRRRFSVLRNTPKGKMAAVPSFKMELSKCRQIL